jgi:predicted Zn-dependent peptidase
LEFRKQVFENGLTVVAERNPDAQSSALGFFVNTGSRDETEGVFGVSHFLEHMVFKGTERRTAWDVNREFDELGARYNAFTSEENTVYWAAVLPEYLPKIVDLLSDLMRPTLRAEDFEMEKNVILEEISMYDDHPSHTAYEKCMACHFGAHPLGQSVLGTTESIGALTQGQMLAYFGQRYRASNLVLGVAGQFDWDELVESVAKHCGHWENGASWRAARSAAPSQALRVVTMPRLIQEHVVHMSAAPPAQSPDRFAADVLATIVGDDTGSRLYWALIDPGLAESAEVSYLEFADSGVLATFVACAPEAVEKVLQMVQAILRNVTEQGVAAEELVQAKNKIASRLVLRSERPMGRLVPLGYNWVYRREYRTVEDDLKDLQAVTLDDVRRVAAQYPLDQITTVAVGPLEEVHRPA